LALACDVLDLPLHMNAPTNLDYNTNHSTAQVVDSAVALVRAELRLVWSHVRRVGSRTAVAIGLTWVSMSLTHIALFVLLVLPLLAATYNIILILAAVVPATLLATMTRLLCIRSWRRVFERKWEQPKTPASTALDLERGDP